MSANFSWSLQNSEWRIIQVRVHLPRCWMGCSTTSSIAMLWELLKFFTSLLWIFSFCGKSNLQKVYLAQGLKGTTHPDRGGKAADHMAPIVTWHLWSHGTHSYKAWRRMNFSFSIFILPAIPAVRRCRSNLGGVLTSYSQEGHSQIYRKLFISLIPQAFCFL